jgi:hypothetical protein
VVAASAPALAGSLREVAAQLTFEWGPVAGDFVAFADTRVRLSRKLLHALTMLLARAQTRRERLGVAFAALGECAEVVGDELRRRAQAALLGAPDATQAAALREPALSDAGDATAIGAAVAALLEIAQLA